MGVPTTARTDMATYDPPQPMWRRNVAGILDFLVIAYFVVLGRIGDTVFQRLFGMKRAKP
jgi:hypothetical protein